MQVARRHTKLFQVLVQGQWGKRALTGAASSVNTQGSSSSTDASPIGAGGTLKKDDIGESTQSPAVETLFTGSKPGAGAIFSGGVKHTAGTTNEDQKQKFKMDVSKANATANASANANASTAANNNVLGLEDEVIKLESFFDSYETVQRFRRCGFSDSEAKLLMWYTYYKLEEKMQWLRENYSPKVDLENETYLFEAAHSELMFEVTNSREITLMNLTNEMIILKRGFNNLDDETIAQIKLNDDIIKMELNQFKHENNLHQKILNLKNSDLNSRIVSDMVSGLKSEIETFRWQLTRAGILSIMIMAVSILGVWNLARRSEEPASGSGHNDKGPLLPPLHDDTDEESHDYEADWDDQVHIQSR